MMRTTAICLTATLAGLSAWSRAGAAQDQATTAWAQSSDVVGASADAAAAWLRAWSPLRPLVDMPRRALRAPLPAGLLDAPAPYTGPFVLAGAPGSLAHDLTAEDVLWSYGGLDVRTASDQGDFRRPLDIADSKVAQVSGFGWSRVGISGVAIGRFVIDRETIGSSAPTAQIMPHMSANVVLADSVEPPMVRNRARAEGALGLSIAGFGIGFSAGIESREHNSVNFALRKSGRAAIPAAAVGVERVLPWFALRVGTYYRWSEPNETNQLRPSPQTTIAYGLHGYDEPFGIEVPPSPTFIFRHDRRATAVGGTITGAVLGATAVLTFEQGSRADDQTINPFSASSDRERWRATGSELRFQLARAIPWGVRAMVVGSVEDLSGDGVRPDLTGTAYTGSDSRRAIEADLRRDFGETWSVAVATGAITTGHERRDFAAELTADANAATTFFSAEVARRASRASVAAGASIANHIPYGSSYLPPVAELGPNYKRFIAPDLAYEVAQARAFSGWVSATARVGGATMITMLRFHGASPSAVDEVRLQPGGDRNGWSVMFGVRP